MRRPCFFGADGLAGPRVLTVAGDTPLRADRDGQVIAVGEHQVAVAWDPDGEAWYVQASSIPGLSGEAPTLDALRDLLPGLIRQASLP